MADLSLAWLCDNLRHPLTKMRYLILTVLLLFVTCYQVSAVDLNVLERHNQLSLKIDAVGSRLKQLESKIDKSYYSGFYKYAKKIYDQERTLYKQYANLQKAQLANNQREIATKLRKFKVLRRNSPQIESLAEELYALESADKETLDQAVSRAKALMMGYDPNGSGVFGQTSLISGNCMPTTDKKTSCASSFVSRSIYVRRLASIDDSVNYAYFQFSDEPVASGVSDEQGMFSIDLEPGTYSIFVEDDGKEYCNNFSADGVACLIEVTEDLKTDFNISIDKAVW